ncbi:MAG: 1,4-dihydroxy-2-naphthoate octaprenyltransferase [Herpetosiphonaceae bacterium]|nr:1,4-dihydroxy-2-naphthoate octaprenyltransferase [Herpetosiphonaceae bacterium]
MKRTRTLSVIGPLVLLLLWEAAVRFGWINRAFLPSPSEVFHSLGELIASGQLARDVSVSLIRIGAGFVLGALPAVGLGLLMGVSPVARALIQPFAAALYPVPKIALLPLIIVVLGLGETSKIATIAISVFFLVVLNVSASVLQVDNHYFEVARSFGARPRDLFWTVALPASLPGIMNSLKLGMGFALTLIVGVEFVGANEGIGWLIWNAYEVYAIDRMLAGLVVIALLGWLLTVALDELEYLLVPWQKPSRRIKEARVGKGMGVWWNAIRIWSYTAATIPVVLGGSIAAYEGRFHHPWWLLLALIGSIAIQAGTNLVNDYYDYKKGADGPQSLGNGGSIRRGELTPRQTLGGGLLAFTIGSVIGLYLVYVTGPFIFWLGLFSVLCGYFYTAGPFALAYVGLGEIAVFIFMGPVMVIGSYYVQTQHVSGLALLASLPVACLVAAILHANNLRDLDSDRQIGKRTLATLFGRAGANLEYYVLVGGTYISLAVLVVLGLVPWLTLISLLTLPLAIRLMRIVANEHEPIKLQPVLRLTGKLHMQFGALLVLGWVAAWAWSTFG